jgi:hypothetical protein
MPSEIELSTGMRLGRNARQDTGPDKIACQNPRNPLLDETTFVHSKPARRQVHLIKIAVVMGHDNDRHTGPMQCRQQVELEFPTKIRILISRPFVQQKERSLFQQAHNESQTFTLTRR